MRILITGGGGFIGKNLVKVLSANHQVDISDLATVSTSQKNVGDYQSLTTDQLSQYQTLIHLAWSSTPALDLPFAKETKQNVLPSIELFSKAAKAEVDTVIFMSSAGAIYGNIATPFTEKSRPQPISSYGKAKLAVENSLVQLKNQIKNVIIFRPTNAVGLFQPYHNDQGLLPALFSHVQEDKPFTMWGNSHKDYLVVDDLAAAVAVALEKKATGIFNVGSDEVFAVSDLVGIVEMYMGKKVKLIIKSPRKHDIQNLIVDSTKVKQVLGWKAEHSLEETIKTIAALYNQ